MDFRSISPRELSVLDHAAFGALLPLVTAAVGDGLDVDLQVERVGAEHYLNVIGLRGDEVVVDRDLAIGVLDGRSEITQLVVMMIWARTLSDLAVRTRARALAGIARLERQG